MIPPRCFAATAVVVVTLASSTSAFTPIIIAAQPQPSRSLLRVTSLPMEFEVPGSSSFGDEKHPHEDHHYAALPHGVHAPITAINSPQELAQFLEQDDRLCVIKFHAAWCKACQRFGLKLQGLANQKGDWISGASVVKDGEMRFASIEFGANTGMCRALKIKRLPSVQLYQNGQQLDAFPCGPSKFPILLDKIESCLHPSSELSSLEDILEQGNQLMNSSEVAGVLQQMIEQEANGSLNSASTKSTSTKKQKKSWWNILP